MFTVGFFRDACFCSFKYRPIHNKLICNILNMHRILYRPIIFLVFVYNNLTVNISGIVSTYSFVHSLSHINTRSNSCIAYPTAYQTWSGWFWERLILGESFCTRTSLEFSARYDLEMWWMRTLIMVEIFIFKQLAVKTDKSVRW